MKELFMAAHEELIEEYVLDHPDAVWAEAYEIIADSALERMRDKFASMVEAYDRWKDQKLLGP